MKNHLMIDLETLGNKSNSVVESISAVFFDIETGEIGERFQIKLKPQEQINAGKIVQWSTMSWWMNQSEEARKRFTDDSNRHSVHQALGYFIGWLDKNSPINMNGIGDIGEIVTWGNSNRFDLGILNDLFDSKLTNIEYPFDFRKERDVRTLVSFKPGIKANMKFEGVAHDGIDDSIHQIKYVCETWKHLNPNSDVTCFPKGIWC